MQLGRNFPSSYPSNNACLSAHHAVANPRFVVSIAISRSIRIETSELSAGKCLSAIPTLFGIRPIYSPPQQSLKQVTLLDGD